MQGVADIFLCVPFLYKNFLRNDETNVQENVIIEWYGGKLWAMQLHLNWKKD
jgi:hypothetical protein